MYLAACQTNNENSSILLSRILYLAPSSILASMMTDQVIITEISMAFNFKEFVDYRTSRKLINLSVDVGCLGKNINYSECIITALYISKQNLVLRKH